MDIPKQGETSGLQLLIVAGACQGERLLSMRQGTRWIVPHIGCDLGLVPRRFRQRLLIVTGLGHLPGLLSSAYTCGLSCDCWSARIARRLKVRLTSVGS